MHLTITRVPHPAMLAYDCVPPVEAVSAYAPQAVADYDADGFLVLESVDREQVLVDPLAFQQAYKRLESKPYAVCLRRQRTSNCIATQPYT